MTIIYGLTDQGFVNKSLPVIRDDINAALRDAFGVSIDLTDRSVLGILVGIFAERIALLWELLQTITASQDPTQATGALLAALAALTGTLRPPAAPSLVTLALTGDDTTAIATGSLASTLSTGKVFMTLSDVVLTAVALWTASTAYLLGAQVSSASAVYQNTQAGTSAGSGGPTGTLPSADGGCLWAFVGNGLALALVDAASVDDGPVVGSAGDISVIATPIGGWKSVTNLAGALLGRFEATDEELRVLREFELGNAGSSPLDALRANLLLVSGVTTVTLFPNNTDITNADGVPPHAIECLVQGGVDQDIYDALLASVAAGIGTFSATGAGNRTGVSVDSQGTSQAESFSRPVDRAIYVVISVVKDPSTYPLDGDQQVQNAIINYGAQQLTGRDAVAGALSAQGFTVSGVVDVTQLLLFTDVIGSTAVWTSTHAYVATAGSRSVVTNAGRTYICVTSGTSAGSGGPTGTGSAIVDGTAAWNFLGNNVVISTRQLATYALANVSVISSNGTP